MQITNEFKWAQDLFSQRKNGLLFEGEVNLWKWSGVTNLWKAVYSVRLDPSLWAVGEALATKRVHRHHTCIMASHIVFTLQNYSWTRERESCHSGVQQAALCKSGSKWCNTLTELGEYGLPSDQRYVNFYHCGPQFQVYTTWRTTNQWDTQRNTQVFFCTTSFFLHLFPVHYNMSVLLLLNLQ